MEPVRSELPLPVDRPLSMALRQLAAVQLRPVVPAERTLTSPERLALAQQTQEAVQAREKPVVPMVLAKAETAAHGSTEASGEAVALASLPAWHKRQEPEAAEMRTRLDKVRPQL